MRGLADPRQQAIVIRKGQTRTRDGHGMTAMRNVRGITVPSTTSSARLRTRSSPTPVIGLAEQRSPMAGHQHQQELRRSTHDLRPTVAGAPRIPFIRPALSRLIVAISDDIAIG